MKQAEKRIPPSVKAWLTKLGRENGAIGGRTAAANMTTEQKRARALKAVAAREAKRKESAA